ncbi:hypothetical protein P3L10_011352 [Capsicum annuum]
MVDNIMERYRKGKIPIEKFELSDYSNKSQVNPHIDKWLDVALQNGVKDLDLTLSSYPFPIFTILAEIFLKELVLKFSDLRPVSLPSGVVNCNSLRKLSLSYVTLDEIVLETLLNSCPFIVSFILRNCWGLKKIELVNLQKINLVSIGTTGENQRIKIRAPNLEHLSYTGRLLEGLDVHLISRSQFLESLVLPNVSERVLGRFNICKSRSLKMLKLWNCDDITKIDATNLVSIEYAGFQIPELKLGRESSQMKHSKIVLHCHDYLNAAWFGKLREFLSNSTSWSQVSLHFRGCSRINMNDWQLHHGVATPQVGVLNVYSTWQNEEFPPFMDALLWTCHPKRLNLQLHSTREKVTCFIDRLMYLKNSSQSTSDGSTPWYSQLKQVKTWKNESWHPLEHKSGNPKETDKYYILLNW